MRLLKKFQILMLLFAILIHSDVILNDYGNGNKGKGVNDQVKGKDNMWIGDANKIDGNVNKVIGNQNKIKGSNNQVHGSGNLIGDISPEQLSRLQNQMFATFQSRFRGKFDFNQLKASPQKQTQKKESIKTTQKIKDSEEKIVRKSKKSIQTPQKQTTQKKVLPIQNRTQAKNNSKARRAVREQLALVFRSYGKSYEQLLQEQIYNLSESINQSIHEQLCSRWNYCLHKNTKDRSFFSSAYSSFAQY